MGCEGRGILDRPGKLTEMARPHGAIGWHPQPTVA